MKRWNAWDEQKRYGDVRESLESVAAASNQEADGPTLAKRHSDDANGRRGV